MRPEAKIKAKNLEIAKLLRRNQKLKHALARMVFALESNDRDRVREALETCVEALKKESEL